MALSENELLLREGAKIVEALGRTLAPLAEVVLHDLSKPEQSIVVIANNLSGRKVGDPATNYGVARTQDPAFPDVLQNYANRFPDGRVVKSTSIGLRNSKGEYVGTICLNIDVSMLSSAMAILGRLAHMEEAAVDIVENFPPPGLSVLREEVEQYAASRNTTPRALTLEQRRELIRLMAGKGLMDLKNAQGAVAEMLGVARSTVYSYLARK